MADALSLTADLPARADHRQVRRREADLGTAAERARDAALVELMSRYQAGSLEAFDRLYGELAPRLRPYLDRRAAVAGGDAEDLLQETFLQIHRSRHTYLPPRPVAPWAFGIARHVLLMSRRAGRRRMAREATVPAPEAAQPAAFDEALVARDRLDRALAATTPERRDSVLLHHLWGLSFREIGRLRSIRGAAAKLRASRGRADLRAALDEARGEPGEDEEERPRDAD